MNVRLSLRQKDDGIALVVALMVTAISFVVMTAVIAQSVHNILGAGYGRRRLAAISAAEAGLNWYANLASTSNPIALSTVQWTHDKGTGWYDYTAGIAATVPERASFRVRAIYSKNSPCKSDATTAAQCSLSSYFTSGKLSLEDEPYATFPDTIYAVVRSIGTVGWVGSKTQAGSVSRALEAYVRLRAVRGGLAGGLMSISLCMATGARVTIEGDLSINNEGEFPAGFQSQCKNGDLVVGTDDSLKVLQSSTDADKGGTLSVRGGGLTVDGNATLDIARDVWTEKAIIVGSGSSALSACLKPPPTATGPDAAYQCIRDDAIGSSVTLGSKAYVLGDQIVCDPSCPPPAGFPELKWNAADWKSPWTIVELSDATSILSLINAASTPTVFHVSSNTPSTCDINFSKADVTVYTRVAVVTKCRFIFQKAGATLTSGASGSALLLISAAPDAGASAASCTGTDTVPGPQDVTISNNQNFFAGLFLYTPCVLWIDGNHTLGSEDIVKGQWVARYLYIKNAVKLIQNDISQYVTSIPGQVTNFLQDIKFVREILPSKALLNT